MSNYQDTVDATLRSFAARNGRTWKDRLRLAWYNGDYRRHGCTPHEAAELQGIRNHPSYGHEYLEDFKP